MKVFISWSGERSKLLAKELKEWIETVNQKVSCFFSEEDIGKGNRWMLEISNQLDSCNVGIICLTPENVDANWILFEAGALAKHIKSAKLFTLLSFGLAPSDITGPLSMFQHTRFSKKEMNTLMFCINNAIESNKLNDNILECSFNKWWQDLQNKYDKISKSKQIIQNFESKKEPKDLLPEILETCRSIARTIGIKNEDELTEKLKRLLLVQLNELKITKCIELTLNDAGIFNLKDLVGLSESEFVDIIKKSKMKKNQQSQAITEINTVLYNLGLRFGLDIDKIFK